MAKFCGKIGYGSTVEKTPGVWVYEIDERISYGDVIRNTRRNDQSMYLNDKITVSNQLSIVADSYMLTNFHNILYAEFMGIKWKVSSIDIEYPRLILTLGGEYNGEQA